MLNRFASYELDDERLVLRRSGCELKLQPKPLRVLVELVREYPRVVPIDELLERVWPEAVVTKASVARAIRALRREIGEVSDGDSIVRNVRGVGYGLTVAVVRQRGAGSEAETDAARAGASIVGREEPLAVLAGGLRAVASGRGAVAIISGEPGIGKTSLAMALCTRASAAHFLVGYGRATGQADARALQPWAEVLKSLARGNGLRPFEASVGSAAGLLLRIAPDLLGDPTGIYDSDSSDDELDSFQVMVAIESVLIRLARQRPLLLVLDDLQWVGETSSALFRRLAGSIVSHRIFLVGCHRDADADASEQRRDPKQRLEALWTALEPLPHVLPPLRLGGLARDALAEVAESVIQRALDYEARQALHRRTGGNPFFAIELARSGAMSPHSLEGLALSRAEAVPERIRTVVLARIAKLSVEEVRLLSMAAILGEVCELRLLAASLERTEVAVLESIDALESAVLLQEAVDRPGHFMFVHDLVRETVLASLSRLERAGLHGRAGAVLEKLHGDRSDSPVGAIAHHYALAVAAGESVDRAIRWARRAGDRARSRLHFADAVDHYERALDWMKVRSEGKEEDLIETLLAAGRAHLGHGDPKPAYVYFWEALERAVSIDAVELVAAAAWPLAAAQYRGTSAEKLQRSIRGALDRCEREGISDHATVARLYAALARSLSYTDAFDRVDAASRMALELARSAEDLDCELKALATRDMVLASEPAFAERAAISRDRIGLAVETGRHIEEFMARIYRIIRLVQEVEPEQIDREISICQELAETRFPSERAHAYLLDLEALRCCWRGELERGEALLPELQQIWTRVDPVYGLMSVGAKRGLIDRMAGRFHPVADSELREALGRSQYALPRPYYCMIAVRLWEEGRVEDARASYEYLSRRDYADIQRDVAWLVTMVHLAELAHRFGDARRSALLARALEPFAGRYAAGHTTGVRGAVDRYRGLLAWTLGDLVRADSLFVSAIGAEVRMDAAPWEVMLRADRARLALDRGTAGGRELARQELDLADAALERRATPGMRSFVTPLRARL